MRVLVGQLSLLQNLTTFPTDDDTRHIAPGSLNSSTRMCMASDAYLTTSCMTLHSSTRLYFDLSRGCYMKAIHRNTIYILLLGGIIYCPLHFTTFIFQHDYTTEVLGEEKEYGTELEAN